MGAVIAFLLAFLRKEAWDFAICCLQGLCWWPWFFWIVSDWKAGKTEGSWGYIPFRLLQSYFLPDIIFIWKIETTFLLKSLHLKIENLWAFKPVLQLAIRPLCTSLQSSELMLPHKTQRDLQVLMLIINWFILGWEYNWKKCLRYKWKKYLRYKWKKCWICDNLKILVLVHRNKLNKGIVAAIEILVPRKPNYHLVSKGHWSQLRAPTTEGCLLLRCMRWRSLCMPSVSSI